MKNFYFGLLLSGAAIALAGCTSQTDQGAVSSMPEAKPNVNAEEEIRATLVEMWDAVEKGDIDRYAALVHPDFTQFGENDSALLVGKEAEVAGMRKSMQKATDVHTEMIDPRITIKGDVAWIVYYWSDSGLSNGKPFATHGKSTRIFVKENGKWLCIHGHYTLLPVGT